MPNAIAGGSGKKPREFDFRPATLKSESKDEFAKLVEELNQDIQPGSFIERMYVHELAEHTWEIMRLRRLKAAMVNNASCRARENILRPILVKPGLYKLEELVGAKEPAQRLASEWSSSQEAKDRVSALLEEAGLDEFAFEAEAFRLTLSDIEKIDRLLISAEARRDKDLRSIAQYQESLARKLQESSERVLAADAVPGIASSDSEN